MLVENGYFVVKNGTLLSPSLTDTVEMVVYKKNDIGGIDIFM